MEKNTTGKCTIWHVRFVVTALDILHWNFCKNCVWEKATNHHFARLKHALYKLFSVILPASQCELTPTATYKKEYCSPVTSQGADSEATLISRWCNVHKFLLLCFRTFSRICFFVTSWAIIRKIMRLIWTRTDKDNIFILTYSRIWPFKILFLFETPAEQRLWILTLLGVVSTILSAM